MPEDRLAEAAALVALLRRRGAKWADVTAEVLSEGSAMPVLRRAFYAGATLFDDDDALDVALDAAATEVRRWSAEGIAVHCLFDDTYPARLRDIHQMPPIVFTRGTVAEDRRAVAVVGTRSPSEQGLKIARSTAVALADSGVTVVSGLAQGIDTAAHEAALRAGGRTVAIIGTGVERQTRMAGDRVDRPAGDEVVPEFQAAGFVHRQRIPARTRA